MTRIFLAHAKSEEADWLATARPRILDALEQLNPGKAYEVVLAREEWRRMPEEGGWSPWCDSISRRRFGVPRFPVILVPDLICGRATAAIVARALSRSVSVLLWSPGPIVRGRTFQRIWRIEQVSDDWVNGWRMMTNPAEQEVL